MSRKVNTANQVTLFVWRMVWAVDDNRSLGIGGICPCCRSDLIDNSPNAIVKSPDPMDYAVELMSLDAEQLETVLRSCPLCGWNLKFEPELWVGGEAPHMSGSQRMSVLREFDINSPEVALGEIGSHLKQHYSDVYALDWRRFEELVCDVFKAHGFTCTLTQRSRDGGADVLVFSQGSKPSAIVECKKYAASRKVGIVALRALVGAAVDFQVRRAYLVTNTDFSCVIREKVSDFKRHGFEIDLVAASEFLSLLEVYDEKLPPIHLLDREALDQIIKNNM